MLVNVAGKVRRKPVHFINMYSASSMLAKARDGNVYYPYKRNAKAYYRNVYLNSDHWKNLRKEKLAQSPRCEKCKTYLSLDVHHKEYRNLYDVSLKDLQTLCRLCHDKEHKIKKSNAAPNTKYRSRRRRNQERQMIFNKKYGYIQKEMNNYVSIHY